MTDLEELLAALKSRGFDVTADQAEAMALRIAGSVPAYLAQLRANDQAAADYRPATGPAPSDKFSEPLAWSLESPAASGLPD